MRTFMKGVLVGVGIGLLIAPMKGEEFRRLLGERFTEWRNSLPPDSPINRYAQEVSERAAYTKEHWRDYAQQAASKAKSTSTTLSNKAQQSMQDLASKAKQTSQEMASKAKQTSQEMASKAKQTVSFSRSDGSATRVIPEIDEQY
jgi:gas vesicle protein